MNKSIHLLSWAIFVIASYSQAFAQKEIIEKTIEREEAMSHFRFIASDELKGRDPARMEINIAARYIAEQFEKYGARELENTNGYYQYVPFRQSAPPTIGELQIDTTNLLHGENMLVLGGPDMEGNYDMVVAGYGLEADYEGKEVEGKIVVVRVGAPERLSPSDLFAAGRQKLALAKEKGAVGLIEMYNVPTTPWNLLVNYLNKPQMTVDDSPDDTIDLPYIWVKDLTGELIHKINEQPTPANLKVSGKVNRKIQGRNVVAFIEGTDPELKNQYLMLSAHYDHLGVGAPNAEGDSIYNGARDNAVGVVAVINAAKFFAENPPKRSVLLCAWTAEEKGLLGSGYFAENPPLPLSQIIYNLNIDNAGYNDTSLITVIGLGRTTVDHLIEEAVADFGLEAVADASPEQGLYDRSDNVNFARRGIPAPTFSLGFTKFDAEIFQHYHQPSDRVENFDLDYAMLYWKSYLLAAQKIANEQDQPLWIPGDKYEEQSKELYSLP